MARLRQASDESAEWHVYDKVIRVAPQPPAVAVSTVAPAAGAGWPSAPVVLETAADRVALVIGNSAYEHTSQLPNPVNDATAMRDALTRLGFDVVFRRDADEDAMEDALGAFEEMSAGADLAVVFYAGHGMEMNGANYLVPVDARLASAAAVGRETVALDDVLNTVADARTRIVILDACRNNPFTRSMRGAVRASVRSGGLAAVAAGAGSLVAYAAAAGDVADDGEGRHSPFTEALLSRIEQPGVEVRIMLGNVGEAVRARTGRQQPFVYSSLSGEHYLGGVSVGPNPAAVESALGLDESARRAVQRGLVSAGFAAGAPDGVFGPMTRAAIRAWQRSRGGTPSGYLDRVTAAALGVRGGSSPTVAGTGTGAPTATASPPATGTAAALQQETLFWESIRVSTDPADFEAYLEQFPNGVFARLARNRLTALGAAADAVAVDEDLLEGLRLGIQLIEEGDYQQALVELDDIASELESSGAAPTVIASAYFYLGVALVFEVRNDAARLAFSEAQQHDPLFRPSEAQFPIRVMSLWEDARRARAR